MPAEGLALLAATAFACNAVVVKRATQRPGLLLGFVLGLLVAVLTTGALALVLVSSWAMSWSTVALFAAGGLAGTGIGGALAMWGVRTAGASVAVPLQSSANPLTAVLAGVVLLGERVGPARLVAIALILLGVLLCVRGGTANDPTGLQHLQDRHRTARWALAAVPLAAGACFAGGDVLRKVALVGGGDPFAGAFIAAAAALVGWLPVLALRVGRRGRRRLDAGLGWFALGGAFAGVAQVLTLLALRTGDLSAVSPVFAVQPIIVLVLGSVVLRGVERSRPGIVVGAVIVCAGVALIAST